MKPRLTSILLALIAIPATTYNANADVIGAGVFYDVGKIYYSSDPNARMPEGGAEKDSVYCWAGAASNATQYWQDFYYNQHDTETPDVPHGIVEGGGYNQPTGTAYTQVYQKTLEMSVKDSTGYPSNFYNWWFVGNPIEGVLKDTTGYYNKLYEGKEVSQTLNLEESAPVSALEDFTKFIVDTFSVEGQSVSLSIAGTAFHAISCWGYELDPETQMVSALLLSDTDDKRFSVFRVNVEVRDSYGDMTMYTGVPGSYSVNGPQITLTTDELAGYYGHDWTWVTEACAIQTPSGTEVDTGAPTLRTTLAKGQTVTTNTSLSGVTTIEGEGVVIGDGKSTIVVTTSVPEAGLSMDGTSEGGGKNPEAGMKIVEGGTVSLHNLTVSNYGDGAVKATGRLYLHDGDVTISNNETTGNGGGINNASYVEIRDADMVSFTGNKASGTGGAIHNDSDALPENDTLAHLVKGEAPPFMGLDHESPTYKTISLRGNKQVIFSGNSATVGGNDIYNGVGGVVNIADNEKVLFQGVAGEKSVAIQNDGYLFLSAKVGNSIDFAASTLESKGKTAIGMDANGRTTDAGGKVIFYDNPDMHGGALSLSSRHGLGSMQPGTEESWYLPIREYTIPALLSNVSVNANEIMGLGTTAAESSVTDTLIKTNDALSIKQLTMNTTDSIISTSMKDVALETVVFDLTNAPITDGKVDLTQMLTGNFTFENVSFLMNGEIGDDVLKNLYFDLSSAYTKAEEAQIKLFASRQGEPVEISTTNVTFAFAQERLPEPATGTLSLIALAGLAARRRRK